MYKIVTLNAIDVSRVAMTCIPGMNMDIENEGSMMAKFLRKMGFNHEPEKMIENARVTPLPANAQQQTDQVAASVATAG